ncbi:MAG: ParB/RepB/Spo0J family partition protein [Mollicutes bacterium]|jgi:ParB family chromosome partitioning protein|nr:ParB/RepB/Spo0J family partition protein [Mollicutes bacterium]
METNRKALGKGLDQLFNNEHFDFNKLEQEIVESATKSDIMEINLDDIRSNPYQPRKHFDEDSLNELAQSIKENGLIQPIIVKRSIKGYELIAGERRCRAAKLAGLTQISAIVRDFSDEEMMELALLENIQREDLSPIEEAEGYFRIISKTNITHEELGKKIGKNRTHITNMLGLLRLPLQVRNLVNEKMISMSHARILSKLSDEDEIIKLADKVVKENLSVHELDDLINNKDFEKLMPIKKRPSIDPVYLRYQSLLRERLGSKITIKGNKITIPFTNQEELELILEKMEVGIDE